MGYDRTYWDIYARSNESRYNGEFAAFVRDLVASLRCRSVLEAGCGTGIDLRLLEDGITTYGADLNARAVEAAREGIPRGEFRRCDVANLPWEDSSVDFVFTHQLLNYLDDAALEGCMSEIYRVARRYVMSCEVHGPDGEVIAGPYRYRDIPRRWAAYDARIISNVDMHLDIEPDGVRFVLLKMPSDRCGLKAVGG